MVEHGTKPRPLAMVFVPTQTQPIAPASESIGHHAEHAARKVADFSLRIIRKSRVIGCDRIQLEVITIEPARAAHG